MIYLVSKYLVPRSKTYNFRKMGSQTNFLNFVIRFSKCWVLMIANDRYVHLNAIPEGFVSIPQKLRYLWQIFKKSKFWIFSTSSTMPIRLAWAYLTHHGTSFWVPFITDMTKVGLHMKILIRAASPFPLLPPFFFKILGNCRRCVEFGL